ncbi:MAG: tetratricopeptide repeat protein [Opitutales bacterium]|nr:tetratricopeptide repeat protein [Opitutales bacterium]
MILNKKLSKYHVLRSLLYLTVCFTLVNPLISSFAKTKILQESLARIQAKALKGDIYYQGALGLFYKNGEHGLPIDAEEATRWVSMAANKEGAFGLATLAAIELEKGKAERGNFLYDEAYLHSNLRELGKDHDPLALYCLGMMEMDNPPRNIPKALRNLEKSADLGFATAQATLGMIYFAGIGVKKDSNIALKWSSMAAQKKIPLGMFYLGLAYSIGDGVEINDDFAIRWIRAAAERELTMAQLTLGMKLALGDGVDRNLELAVQWLRRATLNGSAEAALQLRKYENTLLRLSGAPVTFAKNQPVNEIASQAVNSTLKVDNRSKYSTEENLDYTSSISQNDANQELSLHLPGQSIASNQSPSNESYLSVNSAEQNDKESLNELGLQAYKNKDFKNSKQWFEKAANHKHPESLRYLGIQYFLGQGVQIDYPKAAFWLQESTKAGDLEASRYLRIVKQFR